MVFSVGRHRRGMCRPDNRRLPGRSPKSVIGTSVASSERRLLVPVLAPAPTNEGLTEYQAQIEQRERQLVEGEFVVDAFDAKTKALVWQGTAHTEVTAGESGSQTSPGRSRGGPPVLPFVHQLTVRLRGVRRERRSRPTGLATAAQSSATAATWTPALDPLLATGVTASQPTRLASGPRPKSHVPDGF